MKKVIILMSAFLIITNYAKGQKVITYYDETKMKLKEQYAHVQDESGSFLKEGLYRKWHENGQIAVEENFKNGKQEGLGKSWHENGQVKAEGNYKNGKLEGLWKEWYPNGQIQLEADFKDGKSQGLWKMWLLNGQIMDKELTEIFRRAFESAMGK